MRKYKTADEWKEECPGVKALILEPPGGSRIIYDFSYSLSGKYCLVGIIE